MFFGGFQMEGVSFELTIQGSTRLESRDPRRFGVEIATFPGPRGPDFAAKTMENPMVFQSFFGRKRYYFHSKWPPAPGGASVAKSQKSMKIFDFLHFCPRVFMTYVCSHDMSTLYYTIL